MERVVHAEHAVPTIRGERRPVSPFTIISSSVDRSAICGSRAVPVKVHRAVHEKEIARRRTRTCAAVGLQYIGVIACCSASLIVPPSMCLIPTGHSDALGRGAPRMIHRKRALAERGLLIPRK